MCYIHHNLEFRTNLLSISPADKRNFLKTSWSNPPQDKAVKATNLSLSALVKLFCLLSRIPRTFSSSFVVEEEDMMFT